jgi:hypothetical protein
MFDGDFSAAVAWYSARGWPHFKGHQCRGAVCLGLALHYGPAVAYVQRLSWADEIDEYDWPMAIMLDGNREFSLHHSGEVIRSAQDFLTAEPSAVEEPVATIQTDFGF